MAPNLVTLRSHPQDLVELAEEYVNNPSIGKRIRRSRALAGIRRGVHKPGVTWLNMSAKGIGFGISKIPVPILNDLLKAAWTATVKNLKAHSHKTALGGSPSTADRVKFELKELGDTVGQWDRYRWKIAHAIEEVNKQVEECKKMTNAPCDLWVKLLAKRMYLVKRVAKLRVSVVAVQEICHVTLTWLDQVEQNLELNEQKTEQIFKKDVAQLKRFAGAHGGCSPEFCMHQARTPSMRRSVPVRDWSRWLVSATGTVTSNMAGEVDPIDTTVKTSEGKG